MKQKTWTENVLEPTELKNTLAYVYKHIVSSPNPYN
jgi:hypothetical protein